MRWSWKRSERVTCAERNPRQLAPLTALIDCIPPSARVVSGLFGCPLSRASIGLSIADSVTTRAMAADFTSNAAMSSAPPSHVPDRRA